MFHVKQFWSDSKNPAKLSAIFALRNANRDMHRNGLLCKLLPGSAPHATPGHAEFFIPCKAEGGEF